MADLSDELVAGGGAAYLLTESFLYEINGSIIFNFPVKLNGANIQGRNTSEDEIINASAGTFYWYNRRGL